MINPFNPLISIIIPVYNGDNYLRYAIDSALAQTYSNLEIIVVNDGSTDDGKTEAIAREYGEKIRYFHKPNGGCGSALNFGIEQMRGEYFSWLSHDDGYKPEKLAHQISVLSDFVDKTTILYGGYDVIDEYSKKQFSVDIAKAIPKDRHSVPLYALMRGMVHGCSLLIHKNHFERAGVFNEGLPSTQDYDLWFRMFRDAKLHLDERILIESRVHSEQGTHKIEKHNEECNTLWCGILGEITPDEMSQIDGSPHNFCIKSASFFETAGYLKARDLSKKMAQDTYPSTKVSVVIPIYNRLSLAIDAINSVLKQTYQDLEIILVDDGSKEDMSAIQKMADENSKITYLRQENSGPAKARNTGIQRASGHYVAFLDSDDLFDPEKIDTQLKFMEEQGFLISHTSYTRVDEEKNPLKVVRSGRVSGKIFPNILASCPIAVPTVMGQRQLFLDNPYPENLTIGEDVCLWIKIASKHEVGGIDRALTSVLIGPETAAFNKQKQGIGMINIIHFILNDPELATHDKQIRSLLLDTAAIFEERKISNPQVERQTSLQKPAGGKLSMSPVTNRLRSVTNFLRSTWFVVHGRILHIRFLIKRTLLSLKVNGIKGTIERIRLHAGW